jgi:t-SNARE complex subunit (syntaxin)
MDNDEYATQPSQRPATPIIVQPPRKPQVLPYQQPTTEEARHQLEEDLQQEAALLTVSVQNDLDSVQKMEQRMVDITTLISQFSNLVSEQQEEIWQIHEAAQNTKDNMEKGQDHLVDATERTKRSKHYTAWAVVGMALILLFFHTLKS